MVPFRCPIQITISKRREVHVHRRNGRPMEKRNHRNQTEPQGAAFAPSSAQRVRQSCSSKISISSIGIFGYMICVKNTHFRPTGQGFDRETFIPIHTGLCSGYRCLFKWGGELGVLSPHSREAGFRCSTTLMFSPSPLGINEIWLPPPLLPVLYPSFTPTDLAQLISKTSKYLLPSESMGRWTQCIAVDRVSMSLDRLIEN